MHDPVATPGHDMNGGEAPLANSAISCQIRTDAPAQQEMYCIAGTHLRIPPSFDGRRHRLLIGLPYRYDQEPQRRFPTLYVCDGYWDFMVILGLYGPLWADRAIEEFIIVGLAYGTGYPDDPGIADRTTDLVPTSADTLDCASPTACARYLEGIAGSFVPFVEREYRADPRRRMIAGSSIGGAFSLLSLLRRPEVFSGAIALSPCLELGDGAVMRCEEEYFQRHRSARWFGPRPPLSARVFIALGGADSPKVIRPASRFNRHLARRGYVGLEKRFWIAPDETHATVKGEGFVRGLTYMFGPPDGRRSAGMRK